VIRGSWILAWTSNHVDERSAERGAGGRCRDRRKERSQRRRWVRGGDDVVLRRVRSYDRMSIKQGRISLPPIVLLQAHQRPTKAGPTLPRPTNARRRRSRLCRFETRRIRLLRLLRRRGRSAARPSRNHLRDADEVAEHRRRRKPLGRKRTLPPFDPHGLTMEPPPRRRAGASSGNRLRTYSRRRGRASSRPDRRHRRPPFPCPGFRSRVADLPPKICQHRCPILRTILGDRQNPRLVA
jgi:hypothetical protein